MSIPAEDLTKFNVPHKLSHLQRVRHAIKQGDEAVARVERLLPLLREGRALNKLELRTETQGRAWELYSDSGAGA